MSSGHVTLGPVGESDGEALAELRKEAMRESLERVGRFDPDRARRRFLDSFDPKHTREILARGERVGFLVLRPVEGGLLLDHFYIRPEHQRKGVGAAALALVFDEADGQAQTLRVGALKGSESNAFYARHGFQLVSSTQWDNYYVRHATGADQA